MSIKLHNYIQNNLNSIRATPQMFGGQEAVEMQILILLEAQEILLDGDYNRIIQLWRKTLQEAKTGSLALSGMGWTWPIFMEWIEKFIYKTKEK
jgi:hypothetical protein